MIQKNKTAVNFAKYVSLNIAGMIGLSCYILADTFFVARGIGPDSLAALNLAIPIYSFINGLGLMIGMGAATKYSITKGAKKPTEKDPIFSHALRFTVILSAVLAIAGIFLSELIAGTLGAAGILEEMTATYLKVILLFSPMFMMNNLVICFVRNDKNPKLSMTAMLLGSFSNIILDYLFIFPLGMGIFGAALATGIAPMISLSILSIHFLKKKNGFRYIKGRLDIGSLKTIVSLGASSLITELSSGIVMIVFNMLILGLMGSLGVAAYGIVANISLVVIAIFTGISQGIQPLLSTSYGNGNNQEIRATYNYAIITALIFAAGIYLMAYTYARPIADLFNKNKDPLLTETAVNGMRLYFTAFGFLGFNLITATCFSSIEKASQAFVISSLRGLLIIVPMAFLLAFMFGMNGIWMTLAATEAIVAIVSCFLLWPVLCGTLLF